MVVAVHDVSPATWRECRHLLERLDAACVRPLTLLIVPDFHHRAPVGGDRAFLRAMDERLARTPEEIRAGMQRTAPILHVAPHHPSGTWIVENVATHPDHRRQGLVDALLSEMLERGRQRGASLAGIGVMIGNDRAQRAYEKAGFRVSEERRHPDFEALWGCPGIRSMNRAL